MSNKRGSDVRHLSYAVAAREYRAFVSNDEHVEESSGLSQATLEYFSGTHVQPTEEEIGWQNRRSNTVRLVSSDSSPLTNQDIVQFFYK